MNNKSEILKQWGLSVKDFCIVKLQNAKNGIMGITDVNYQGKTYRITSCSGLNTNTESKNKKYQLETAIRYFITDILPTTKEK